MNKKKAPYQQQEHELFYVGAMDPNTPILDFEGSVSDNIPSSGDVLKGSTKKNAPYPIREE